MSVEEESEVEDHGITWALDLDYNPPAVGKNHELYDAVHTHLVDEHQDQIKYGRSCPDGVFVYNVNDWKSVEEPDVILEDVDENDPRSKIVGQEMEDYAVNFKRGLYNGNIILARAEKRADTDDIFAFLDEFEVESPGIANWNRKIAELDQDNVEVFEKDEKISYDAHPANLFYSLAERGYGHDRPEEVEMTLDYSQDVRTATYDELSEELNKHHQEFLEDLQKNG